jgi:uncharacterized membrane protein YraQ (UPF0718 family)
MILLASIFNWSIALAYVLVGLLLAVLGGTLIGRAKMERYVEDFVLRSPLLDLAPQQLRRGEHAQFARAQVSDIFRRVWAYVLIGVGIGAAIHNWIPLAWIEALLGQNH